MENAFNININSKIVGGMVAKTPIPWQVRVNVSFGKIVQKKKSNMEPFTDLLSYINENI